MSTDTMKSSDASARSSRPASGVERTGFPATVMSARMRPSPGVSISSASVATGNSPNTSGRLRTRLCRRPKRTPRPTPGVAPGLVGPVLAPPAAGSANIAPPSRSRLPASAFTTSTSHDEIVPNSWVQVPMRP
jgi:hypothetical protein